MRKYVEDRKEALGLEYVEGSDAPRVVIRACGEQASLMVDFAGNLGIPVISGPRIIEALQGTGVGDFIPESAFEVVAQLYRFVYELDRAHKGMHDEHMACK